MDLNSMSTADLLALRQQMVANKAINQNESSGAPDNATGIVNAASGARGNMQVMPATAQSPGFGVKPSDGTPQDDARMGRDYRSALQQKYGDEETAAIAYNWGPGNTDNWIANGRNLSQLPTETLKYLKNYKGTVQQNAVQMAPQETQQLQQPPPDANTMPANWQAPGSVTMGIGDTLGGATRAIVHGMGKVANWLAPNSDFAQQAAQAEQQIDATRLAEAQRYAQARAAQAPARAMVQGAIGAPAGELPDIGRAIGHALPALAIPGGAPESVLGAAGMGAGAGALIGAANTNPGESYPQMMATGAALGGAGGAAGALLGRAVGGVPMTPEAQQMAGMGVQPLPGQAMGGMPATIEDKLTSVPFLGDAIKSGQRAGVQQYNRAMYQNALAPIGENLPDDIAAGSQGVAHVADTIGERYQQIAQQAQFIPRGQFIRDYGQVRNDLAQTAPSMLPQFDNIADNQITAKLQNGVMTGPQWNDSRSFIAGVARQNRLGNTTPDNRALAGALDDLNDAITAQVERNSPGITQPLQQANQAWARYKQIERAAGSMGAMNNGNVFTPAQFSSAVRAGSTNAQRATNTGLNADVAHAAQQVLGSKYPDSGTAGRSLLGLLAGHAVAPAAIPPIAGASALYGTQMGRNAMYQALFNRPEFLQRLGAGIVGASPLLSGAGVSILNGRTADQQ
jgi:hypothetical protein